MIPGAVHRSPGICITAEENTEKPQLGDRLMKGICDQSSPQMGPFPPNEVGRIAQHVRKGKRRKGRGRNISLLWYVENYVHFVKPMLPSACQLQKFS